MGIKIDLNIYEHQNLVADLVAAGAKDRDLLERILANCGHVIGDRYVLLNNEYYEGGSPYYNLSTLIDAAFPGMYSFDTILGNKSRQEGISYVEVDDVAEELGITIPDHEDEDEDDEEDD